MHKTIGILMIFMIMTGPAAAFHQYDSGMPQIQVDNLKIDINSWDVYTDFWNHAIGINVLYTAENIGDDQIHIIWRNRADDSSVLIIPAHTGCDVRLNAAIDILDRKFTVEWARME